MDLSIRSTVAEEESIESQVALKHLLKLAIELSSEHDTDRLLEHILESAIALSNAEGGTIYSVSEDAQLKFATLINEPLGLHMGGTSGKEIPFPAIPIYLEDGSPNESALVALAAAKKDVIRIDDVYDCTDYDLSAARAMDKKTGYHTQSVLTVPMANHERDLNGVLQLINPRSKDKVVRFSADLVELICSISSLAAVALTNRQLIDDMETLFQAFTRLIAKAIDEKSPYTGGHCRRVPELTMMIADAVHNASSGPMAEFQMTAADRHELSLAGWLHDCGKIAIPEYVMDKATKLHSVYDRIELVVAKIEIAKRDIELKFSRQIVEAEVLDQQQEAENLKAELQLALDKLDEESAFLSRANIGGEFMKESDQQRVQDLASNYDVSIGGVGQPLLTEEEVYNLSIARGTLTQEERLVINKHMDITLEMLEALPFPKHLRRVPEFAGGHHEKMDGTGYPKGLTRDQMSVPARIMAIADIFEALTAADRPYKDAKPLSECLFIMGKMKLGDHIDPDLFDVFVSSGVYLDYAHQYLKPEQIDDIDVANIPGYSKP
ncbi:HD domain-containing phosphohydrolase [Pseudoalteromonas obscura]|uniref:HD domain-containing phosphohydrolase n=1 Tax=Pseudoalteromonas obscura TaxID=3048491 RepID=A0ABT7EF20_9GAMM|nr:HD domain-containing phosphohydrolase [Pseudoalteromonas sp. P94(2023)]MDK2593878.1 HD domain-containing phosphohydrolase [Pseudoalteromonas sp. P94(2023)]